MEFNHLLLSNLTTDHNNWNLIIQMSGTNHSWYVGHIHGVILSAARQVRNKLHSFALMIVHSCPITAVLYTSLVLIHSASSSNTHTVTHS